MACALFGFIACTQETIDEQTAIRVDASETIKVGFEDSETRIQLNSAQKTVWTKEDLVSVFYRSDANQKWQYQGETGERVGNLKRVEDATATTQTTKTVVVYPYSKNYWLNTDNYAIDATLPATQYYTAGSYGVGSNLMVSQSEFTQFSLKSVCGWLKLQLTGNGEVVKSIKFSGNNGEQVAGLIYVDTETAKATLASEMGGSDDNNAGGNLVFDDTILTEVVLDCGEGVELGAEATAFYIALPPQTFENGFTVVVECDDHKPMTLSTSNALTIERNTIQPMASVECDATPNIPYNQIWYRASEKITPVIKQPSQYNYEDTYGFGANIISNEWDETTGEGIITFDGVVTHMGNQVFSGKTSLIGISVPSGVKKVQPAAFFNCTNLNEVHISSIEAWCNIYFELSIIANWPYSNPLYYAKNLYLNGELVTDLIIPNGVKKIPNYAFHGCTSIKSVIVGNDVEYIGARAFAECNHLTSVIIPNANHDIDLASNVFALCPNLESVTLGNSIKEIPIFTFNECTSLESITIPESVTEIDEYAFDGCTSLSTIYCRPITPPAIYYDYSGGGKKGSFPFNADMIIYVPIDSYNEYTKYTTANNSMGYIELGNWYAYKNYIQPFNFVE